MFRYRFRCRKQVLAVRHQDGYILIASLAMLIVLAGVVLICTYPSAYETSRAPRHRKDLRRIRVVEQGIFGRLADQPGGVYSAGGGYISDLGPKMIVQKYANEPPSPYVATRLSRVMDFWFYRRFSNIIVLYDDKFNPEGADDIYRYNPATGFWVGYRGKRYLTKPPGEERLRGDNISIPAFRTAGGEYNFELTGDFRTDTFLLKTVGEDLTNTPVAYQREAMKRVEHPRYYNPVERLVVRVNDRRPARTHPLSALLVYAKQPDPENPDDATDFYPRLPSRTVTELPYYSDEQGNIKNFTFRWDPDPGDTGPFSIVDISHTFEIGLKKLILLEDGLPVFSCGINVPPVREYQCVEKSPYACKQNLSDQYVVEIDYDG
jgi:hypothetical protein